MSENDTAGGRAVGTRHIAILAFAMLIVLFSLVEGTRPLAFALLWVVAPIASFGTLLQVVRGSVDLRSGRGLIFSMWCGAISTVSIPLGALLVDRGLSDALTFLGFLAALVAVGFARLSVTEAVETTDRDVPPELDLEDDEVTTLERPADETE